MINRQRIFALIACEKWQAECEAFRALGVIAYSCDIEPAKKHPEWHICGDVTPLANAIAKQWTAVIREDMRLQRDAR